MSEDIIERMRFWSKTRNDNPTAWNLDCGAAADEIEQLRKERDEARREVLLWVKERCSWAELSQEIKHRGWEYLKKDGK